MKIFWTREKIVEVAEDCQSRNDFRKKHPSAANAADHLGIFEEIAKKWPKVKRKTSKWTKELIFEAARKCKTRSEFQDKYSGAFKTAQREDMVAELWEMFPAPSHWTEASLRKEALKYQTRQDFYTLSSGAYTTSRNLGIMNEICSHMPKRKARESVWCKKRLSEETKKYKTVSEFRKACSGGAKQIARTGTESEFFDHFTEMKHHWTFDELQKEALKYNSRSEFSKGSHTAYQCCISRKIIDLVAGHMVKSVNESHAEQLILAEVKKYYPDVKKYQIRKISIEGHPYAKGFDIDIFIPSLSIGIEFDGRYWHSIEGLRKSRKHWPKEAIRDYHQIKDTFFESKGIKILHIREQDWLIDHEAELQKIYEFIWDNRK